MQTINSIISIFYREYKITFGNIYDLVNIILFFLLGIIIFIFAIGINEEILENVSVGVIWSLLLISSIFSIKRFYHDDFEDGNIFLFRLSGLSYELIVLIKLIAIWFFFQLPFIVIIPIACIILKVSLTNSYLVLITFLISSPILTSISSISGSMNLLSNRNFAIGSVMVMILSIPLIIFSVGIINAPNDLIKPQLSILTGILFFFLAITPWICGACIKEAMRNK